MSILSEPRISEFEFVPLSADSIVIAYLRGGWPRGQAISTYFMRRDPRPAHGKTRVYSRFLSCFRHAKPSLRASGTFIAGRESYTRPSFVFSTRVLARAALLLPSGNTGFLLPAIVPVAPSSTTSDPIVSTHGYPYLAPSVLDLLPSLVNFDSRKVFKTVRY